MNPIDRLILADRESPKRICVVGCSMADSYVHGDLLPSQDGCMKFVERLRVECPGGAAGAARQLFRWHAEVGLISLLPHASGGVTWGRPSEAWNQIDLTYALDSRRLPCKERFLDASGRIVFRRDLDNGYGLDANGLTEARDLAFKAVKGCHWDAVLISDYEKGFVNEALIRDVIGVCREKGVPVVADAKRDPHFYSGAVLKVNADYAGKHGGMDHYSRPQWVITRGPDLPLIGGPHDGPVVASQLPAVCRNHVGAGDCFSAILVLALAHGLSLEEAATVAHSAGRVYVQHPHGRPPWPHEIRRDLDPVGGKVVSNDLTPLHALRKSAPGRLVFTNGVFGVPTAGHAWLMGQAKSRGDLLVVGVNSDDSSARVKPGRRRMTAAERCRILASMAAVDWVAVFDEDEPLAMIRELKPDVLVKGPDYAGKDVPGSEVVPEVWFAPESPYPRHSSDLHLQSAP